MSAFSRRLSTPCPLLGERGEERGFWGGGEAAAPKTPFLSPLPARL